MKYALNMKLWCLPEYEELSIPNVRDNIRYIQYIKNISDTYNFKIYPQRL